jgi:hypothetical protein
MNLLWHGSGSLCRWFRAAAFTSACGGLGARALIIPADGVDPSDQPPEIIAPAVTARAAHQ